MSTLKVTNIKAADGTSALSIADGTGKVSLATGSDLALQGTGKVFAPNGIVFSSTELTGDDASTTTRTESSNLLDDYEEGTWSPTLAGFTETGTSTATGRYTKIGRIVYFSLEVSTTGTIASTINTSNFSGLPFQVLYSTTAIQGGRGSWADAFKGNCLVFTDEKIYPEAFSARDDVILITGFYETT